jgi:CHAT domain-containing protein
MSLSWKSAPSPKTRRAGSFTTLIASLWPVAAPATAGLMNRFYIHLHSGESPDRALRAAKLEMIAKLRATPYEWHAFQLYSR